MGELLIPILLVILPPAVVFFLGFVKSSKFPAFCKVNSYRTAAPYGRPALQGLNCRIKLIRQENENCAVDTFGVEICGLIHAPDDMHNAVTQISITDITDRIPKAQQVYSRVKQWQSHDCPIFVYKADLGKLPNRLTNLSDWMTVAKINLDWLLFPRKGKRNLQFTTKILSCQTEQELAWGTCTFTYENFDFGYIDLQENIHRTKNLAVALAFAVSAADNNLSDSELELIKNWISNNINLSRASDNAKRKLDKALNKTAAFFRRGHQLNTHQICRQIIEITPLAERYDILELCLHVAKADGTVAAEELALLKDLAAWLEVDIDRFREMMEKILPADIHEVKDAKLILGLTSNMSQDDTRQLLNKEYRKWNARVTNTDPEIQAQADYMLNLIAQERAEHIN